MRAVLFVIFAFVLASVQSSRIHQIPLDIWFERIPLFLTINDRIGIWKTLLNFYPLEMQATNDWKEEYILKPILKNLTIFKTSTSSFVKESIVKIRKDEDGILRTISINSTKNSDNLENGLELRHFELLPTLYEIEISQISKHRFFFGDNSHIPPQLRKFKMRGKRSTHAYANEKKRLLQTRCTVRYTQVSQLFEGS